MAESEAEVAEEQKAKEVAQGSGKDSQEKASEESNVKLEVDSDGTIYVMKNGEIIEEINQEEANGLEAKVSQAGKKGSLEGKTKRQHYERLAGKEYSSKSDSTSEEIGDLIKHFWNRIKNAGKAEEGNKKIEKGDYTGRELSVLILGTLQIKDDGYELANAIKGEGKDCYIIEIDYSNSVEKIAEDISSKIIELKEKTNATRITAIGFSRGGKGLLEAVEGMGLDRYVNRAVYVNTPLSNETTGFGSFVKAAGGIPRDGELSALSKGCTTVPSLFIYYKGDGIVPFEPNSVMASSLVNSRVAIALGGSHTEPLNNPNKATQFYVFDYNPHSYIKCN